MREACTTLESTSGSQRIISCSRAVKWLFSLFAVLSVLNLLILPHSGAGLVKSKLFAPAPIEKNRNSNAFNSGFTVKLAGKQSRNEPTVGEETLMEIKESENRANTGEVTLMEIKENMNSSNNTVQGQELAPTSSDGADEKSSIIYDYSHPFFNICSLEGDIRVVGNSSVILLLSPSPLPSDATSTYKIKPFTRKWEEGTMANIRELTILHQHITNPNQAPSCDVTHDVPALIFATGAFGFNLFHVYTDLLIPLFQTSYQYKGKVQFAVTNFSWDWLGKFQPIIKPLSHYPLLNLDNDTRVHCFCHANIGLRSHGALAIDPSLSPYNFTIQDYRRFVRKSLSLKRSRVERIDKNSGKKPRLVILLRKWTRAFTNEQEIVSMAESVGFEVVKADVEMLRDFPRIAHVVNSGDVLVGLHGAGITNMIYLPDNATIIQIIPWGSLSEIGQGDYGRPAKPMGLKHVEHEITAEESTLMEKYGRDHAVIRNPVEIHKQGWRAVYQFYLHEQNVKLDVHRFRGVLEETYRSL